MRRGRGAVLAAVPTAFSIQHDSRRIEVVPESALTKDRVRLLIDGEAVAEAKPNDARSVVAADGVEVRVVMPRHGVTIISLPIDLPEIPLPEIPLPDIDPRRSSCPVARRRPRVQGHLAAGDPRTGDRLARVEAATASW